MSSMYVQSGGRRTSPKSRLAALLLCFFLGSLGVHRFYVNKVLSGIFYLCTGGLFGFGILVDLIMILTGSFTDDRGLPLVEWEESSSTAFRPQPYAQPYQQSYQRPSQNPARTLPPTPNAKKNVKYCAVCGSVNEMVATYCASCGTSLEE